MSEYSGELVGYADNTEVLLEPRILINGQSRMLEIHLLFLDIILAYVDFKLLFLPL